MQSTKVGEQIFNLPVRYSLLKSKVIRRDQYGTIITARDMVEEVNVAIKRMDNLDKDDLEYLKHSLKHIRMMKLLDPHPNFITFFGATLFNKKSELYVVTNKMDCSIDQIIKSGQELTEDHVQHFAKQLIEAMKALHAIGIVHSNIHPVNILVNRNCDLCLTGLGSALLTSNHHNNSADHRRTLCRWYRAPELLLLLPEDTRPSPASDMFAVACVLAELYLRKPVFPGSSPIDQVTRCLAVSGFVPGQELGFTPSEDAQRFLLRKAPLLKTAIGDLVPAAGAEARALLELLLAVNPAQRPSAEQALRHPFLADADVPHDYSKTYLTRPPADLLDFELEHSEGAAQSLRALLEAEVPLCADQASTPPLFFPLAFR